MKQLKNNIVDLLQTIKNSRIGHIGTFGEVYLPQVSKTRIDILLEEITTKNSDFSKNTLIPDNQVEEWIKQSREHAILSNLFSTLQIAVDTTSEARGWTAIVFEVRRIIETTKQLLNKKEKI